MGSGMDHCVQGCNRAWQMEAQRTRSVHSRIQHSTITTYTQAPAESSLVDAHTEVASIRTMAAATGRFTPTWRGT